MDENNWSDAWQRHLDNYQSAVPRTGIFIETIAPNYKTILEVACGSGRDSLYLSEKGKCTLATDFAKGLIAELKHRFGNRMEAKCEDAFSMSMRDKSFDFVFSNGFLVLFPNNDNVISLILERFRIAKHAMLFLEHNKRNEKLRKLFDKKKHEDQIYDIRFWDPEELKGIITTSLNTNGLSYKKIIVKKFGGPWDRLYAMASKIPLLGLSMWASRKVVPRLYQFQCWQHTERVAIIVYK